MSFWQKLLVIIGGPTTAMTYAGVELAIGDCTEKITRINRTIVVVSAVSLTTKALERQFPDLKDELDTAYKIGTGVVIALALYKLRISN